MEMLPFFQHRFSLRAAGHLEAGYYVLQLHAGGKSSIQIGEKGTYTLDKGWYFYIGSAKRGLKNTLARHYSKGPKRLHWHIDYLLADPNMEPAGFLAFPREGYTECLIVQGISEQKGAVVPVPGFGASDCSSGCRAHLIFFRFRKDANAVIQKLLNK